MACSKHGCFFESPNFPVEVDLPVLPVISLPYWGRYGDALDVSNLLIPSKRLRAARIVLPPFPQPNVWIAEQRTRLANGVCSFRYHRKFHPADKSAFFQKMKSRNETRMYTQSKALPVSPINCQGPLSKLRGSAGFVRECRWKCVTIRGVDILPWGER